MRGAMGNPKKAEGNYFGNTALNLSTSSPGGRKVLAGIVGWAVRGRSTAAIVGPVGDRQPTKKEVQEIGLSNPNI